MVTSMDLKNLFMNVLMSVAVFAYIGMTIRLAQILKKLTPFLSNQHLFIELNQNNEGEYANMYTVYIIFIII
jgi:hypothetical protein